MHRSPLMPIAAAVLALSSGSAPAQHPVLPTTIGDFGFIHALVVADTDDPLYGFHHFYMSNYGATAFAKGGPYPVGTVFLGIVYGVDAAEGVLNEGDKAGYLMMTKIPEAEDTGGWQFAEFDADGRYVEQDVKAACFECHTQVRDRDFVFSRPLGAAAAQ